MSLTKDLLFDILSKQDGEISSVESVSEEPGVADHQNFLSKVLRITSQVKLKNNENKVIKLIVKIGEDGMKKNGYTSDVSFFINESKAYELLSDVKEYIKLRNPYMEIRWAQHFYSNVHSSPYMIVLEDLNEIGYRSWPKARALLDMKHALIALEYLGKCHAMSRLYIVNKNIKNEFQETKFNYLKEYFQNAIKKISEAVKIYDEKWNYISDYLLKISPSVIDLYKECNRSIKDDFPVLSLGDVWTNNILFKYSDSDFENPISARFIDFQFADINSFAWDLHYLLCISLLPRFRLDNIDKLISCYQKSFLQTMLDLGGDSSLVPSCQQINNTLDKLLLTSFLYSMISSVELNSATDDDYKRTKDDEVSGLHVSVDWYLNEPDKNGYIDNIKYYESKGLFQRTKI